MAVELLVRGGTPVAPCEGPVRADLLIRAGKIAGPVGPNIEWPADRVIDIDRSRSRASRRCGKGREPVSYDAGRGGGA